jgi:phosphatidylserine decarboxylase
VVPVDPASARDLGFAFAPNVARIRITPERPSRANVKPMALVSSRTAARILEVLPRERITRLVGRVAERPVPRGLLNPVLSAYVRAFRVDLGEAQVPAAGFASFNDFFTRRLRDGVHSVDPDPMAVVSPADGRLDDAGDVDASSRFLVKGKDYDAAELLGSAADAERYHGGRYAVVYLSPRDYHRVHSPVDGVVRGVRHMPGTLYPVNAIGVEHVPRLFARNERVVVHVETERFGDVAVVFVGAFIVGRITLTIDAPPRPPHGGEPAERRYDPAVAPRLARGDELGAFLLGSTVVLMLQKPPKGAWRDDRPPPFGPVRMGQSIAWLAGE